MKMSIEIRTRAVGVLAGLFSALFCVESWAQQGDDAEIELVEEVITIGVRGAGRTATDSPVPVDALNYEALRDTGQTEVGRMIQALAPSFNFPSSSISDGTDSVRPATLRGLGPDQTLVLVNGKRRHGSALVHVNSSVGRGTAGTDMNAIPQIAIERVEILRDGAAAQYGSDAIGGVINLVLKKGSQNGELSTHLGGYAEGDGLNSATSFHYGREIAGTGSWQIALEYRDRERSNRAGLTGACQYLNVDASTTPTTVQAEVNDLQVCQKDANDNTVTSDPREIAFNRLNFRVGDADSQQFSGVFNLALPVTDHAEFYLFATYSDRANESAGFYRRASQPARNPHWRSDGTLVNNGEAFIKDGFLPLIRPMITDYSVDLGVTGEFSGWEWDISVGHGHNSFEFHVANSLNASLVSQTGASPRDAFSGELVLELITQEINLYRPFGWGSLAFGTSYRQDKYQLKPGEELSYMDYDTDKNGVSLGAFDASGGIQVFPGFKPSNAVNENRDSFAVYVDAEWNPSDAWLLGGAARYENYSDFGSTINFKGTSSFKVNDGLLLRAALSSGFRAPSLQQKYFNATSTVFVTGPDGSLVGNQRGTFRNDSALAQAIGIPALTEEKSVNISAGVVLQPVDGLTVTLDYYRVTIKDRVVISGSIGKGLLDAVDAALTAANADRAVFFLNAADTETEGVDLIAQYNINVGPGRLQLSLGANITKTQVTSINPPTALSQITGIDKLLFTPRDRTILEDWQPDHRVTLGGTYTQGGWTGTVNLQRYGSYTITQTRASNQTVGDSQKFGAEQLVDLRLAYAFDTGLTLVLGGNNVFDQTPDRTNSAGQTRAGTILDDKGNVVVDSLGAFQYSRASVPFGFNGAYWYGSLSWEF